MTRINVVPVEELTDKHLVAEYHELPRVFNLIRKAIERGEDPLDKRNPVEYTLGEGHVRFFYPRLRLRQASLVVEMTRRGFNVNFPDLPFFVEGLDLRWWKGYQPTPEALRLNRERIAERLNGKD